MFFKSLGFFNIKKLYHEMSRNDPESPTLDPGRNFIDPEKKKSVFRMTEVGRNEEPKRP